MIQLLKTKLSREFRELCELNDKNVGKHCNNYKKILNILNYLFMKTPQ